jgi:hypothetical protein
MNKFILTIFLFLFALCFLLPNRASAAATGNVSGQAWSENFGWISFSCADGGTCSPAGTDYKTIISTTTATYGNFSGYAWSERFGWISFNEGDAPSYTFNSNSLCSTYTCDSNHNPNCTACFNKSDHKVYGWAKILSMGDEGWIKFSKEAGDGGSDFNVSIEPFSGDFSGWAWNNNDNGHGVGWISFNSADPAASSSVAYKVAVDLNTPPTVANMTAPNWSPAEACTSSAALVAKLKWQVSDPDPGSSESAYQIIFNDVDNPNTPIFDTGKCDFSSVDLTKCLINPGVNNYPVQLNASSTLAYNHPYYWWVRVWDDYGASSTLAQYDTAATGDTDNNDGISKTFTTYKHNFPKVDFTWNPVTPSMGENTIFTDTTVVYGGAGIQSRLWTFTNGVPATSASTSPVMYFNSQSNNSVNLVVTDTDGYSCGGQKSIANINACLPFWQETNP